MNETMEQRMESLRAQWIGQSVVIGDRTLKITMVDLFGSQPHVGFVSTYDPNLTPSSINGWMHVDFITRARLQE